ncbi:MAG: lysylphosphatidylglycerol synthase transmembrane domain-containing protein [Candidatus ainarchaeum sp.]|nr:lysylphosphatidylglycerol synthase transmembrane domain-containing protein [Candidatus ainarchaeum sp.]
MVGKFTQFFLILLGIFAVLLIFSRITNSFEAIAGASLFFLAIACFFFVLSITIWVFSWAFLLKTRSKLPFWDAVLAGFSSVYGSIDPFQFGADALRALFVKNWLNSSYSDSLAASMITKGLKFLLMALLAGIAMVFFVFTQNNALFAVSFFSGFVVIALAALLFLLPMDKKIGFKIADFFRHLSKFWKKFFLAENFFRAYSGYLQGTSKRAIAIVFAAVTLSLFFEFVSLFFSFEAVGIPIPFLLMAVLFVIIIVLSRVPVLPYGIGLVEAVGFSFVSLNAPALPEEKIAAALALYAIARIFVPTILSFAVYLACAKKFSTAKNFKNSSPENVSRENKGKKPEQAVQKNN